MKHELTTKTQLRFKLINLLFDYPARIPDIDIYFIIASEIFLKNLPGFLKLCFLKKLNYNDFNITKYTIIELNNEKNLKDLLEIIFLMKENFSIAYENITYDDYEVLFHEIKKDIFEKQGKKG